MKTKEMIEWLQGVMKYGTFVKDIFDENDEKISVAIIKTLREHDKLLKVHTQWYKDLKAVGQNQYGRR